RGYRDDPADGGGDEEHVAQEWRRLRDRPPGLSIVRAIDDVISGERPGVRRIEGPDPRDALGAELSCPRHARVARADEAVLYADPPVCRVGEAHRRGSGR